MACDRSGHAICSGNVAFTEPACEGGQPGRVDFSVAARREVEIAVTMVPEILPVRGADLAGPLLQELQNATDLLYVVAILSSAKAPDAAEGFIEFISGTTSASDIKSKGLEPG